MLKYAKTMPKKRARNTAARDYIQLKKRRKHSPSTDEIYSFDDLSELLESISSSNSESSDDSSSINISDFDDLSLDDIEPDDHIEKLIEPLASKIVREIRNKSKDLSKLPNVAINTGVTCALLAAINDIVETVTKSCDPKGWLEDKTKEKKLIGTLQKIRTNMFNEKPTLARILEANISDKLKQEAIRLFDIMEDLDDRTQECHDVQDKIISILNIQNLVDRSTAEKIDTEEKRLTSSYLSSDYELKKKIFELEAPDKTKARIYEMYSKLISMDKTNGEYAGLYDKLKGAVALPH